MFDLDDLEHALNSAFSKMKADILAEIRSSVEGSETISASHCPSCGSDQVYVLDTRTRKDGTIRRVKVCMTCEERFGTEETFRGIIEARPDRKAGIPGWKTKKVKG